MTIKNSPVFRNDMTIEELSQEANRYLETEWKSLYEVMYDELAAAFAEIEDAAYGLYLDRIMPPIFDQLEEAGFNTMEELKEHDFVIGKRLIFRNSLEKWGTEDNRSRMFWNVVRNLEGQPIGTLLTEIPHSHLGFDIPSAPVVYSVKVSEKGLIVEEMRRIKGE
ncbi:DUF6022 family protein [Paenibacillus sp. GCM10027627]|uniref:DUF6022 family protein n=1 Tax=unclassified Paenibacillus TaxID=185978 RepID=UPI0036281E7A